LQISSTDIFIHFIEGQQNTLTITEFSVL